MRKKYESGFQKVYLKKSSKEFIRDYEVEFTHLTMSDITLGFTLQEKEIDNEKFEINYIYSGDYEISVLDNAYNDISKHMSTILKLQYRYMDINHICYDPNKGFRQAMLYRDFHLKILFLDRKLANLGQDIKISNILLNTNTKTEIKKDNLLIGGKKPNISERYKIVNELLGVKGIIDKKNISFTEKNILLAHILGCSQQVARELFNGTQEKRTPIREDLINSYLDKFK
jgi:hypothetical protein